MKVELTPADIRAIRDAASLLRSLADGLDENPRDGERRARLHIKRILFGFDQLLKRIPAMKGENHGSFESS